MLKEKEYLAFTMQQPDKGVVVHVFDIVDEGVKRYGPYKLHGAIEKKANTEDAAIITICFEDGTMPIDIDEFDERVHAGETWLNNEYNIFTRIKPIGTASMFSKALGKKLPLHEVLERDGQDFYVTMFEQCMECMDRLDKKKVSGKKKMNKAEKMYKKHLSQMASSFPDEQTHEMYKRLVVDLLDEAYNLADASLVEFILEKERELSKKKVPASKRVARIVRAVKKKCDDDYLNGLGNK